MDTKDEQTHDLLPLKRALFALKDLRTRLHVLESKKFEPIAIIGMSCRFPGGADDPEAFWRLLHDEVDAIREVPASRWDVDRYYDPDPTTPGKMVSRCGGFIDQVDRFDPHFFGISPREALSMDPQHRLLLETAWEALERAGIPPSKLAGSLTGVYVGISTSDYSRISLRAGDLDRIDPYVGTGGAFSVAAGRLSHFLALHGPNFAVDTACSSSLVAVHLACQALRAGQANLALVGGVNLILSPESSVYMSKARALSPDGHCKAFDAAADGYGRGEGCGVVVLKRLSDAQADKDNILALIRGTSINHDGPSSGLTVPNGLAQQAVIKAALADAGILQPQSIDYLEAHGTGTPLGDPIEIRAAASVLCQNRSQNRPLYIGSVKTNIGHLEAAAGIAGLIKVVLAIQHSEIPSQLHFHNPSPHIDWNALAVKVVRTRQCWQEGERLAGLSSFGFSGTNAHVILGSLQTPESVLPQMVRPFHLVTLSAKTELALAVRKRQILAYLDAHPETDPGQLAHTLNAGRSHFSYRLAVAGSAVEDLRTKLSRATGRNASGTQPRIAFFFSGEGTQYPGMGRALYKTQPTFSAALDECNRLLRPNLNIPLLDVLFADEAVPLANHINEPMFMQTSLFAIEYALARLWESWGIRPAAMMGYGIGEYVAACLAGVFSLEDGLKLVMERSRLMQVLCKKGKMAVVFGGREAVNSAIADYPDQVAIAAENGPENIVISGEGKSVVEIVARFKEQGVVGKLLPVTHAFHSPLVMPILGEFGRTAAQISYAPPRIGLISNLTGKFFQPSDIVDGAYWGRQTREAVQFAAGMQTLHQRGYRIFVELGPDSTLLALGHGCVPDQGTVWLPSLRQGRDDWQQVLEVLAELYIQGIDVDWASYDRDYSGRRLILPVYPFERERYWAEAVEPDIAGVQLTPVRRPALIGPIQKRLLDDWFYKVSWHPSAGTAAPNLKPPSNRRGAWVIFADDNGVGAKLAERFEEQGEPCALVFPGKALEHLPSGEWRVHPGHLKDLEQLIKEVSSVAEGGCAGVIHLWGLDTVVSEETALSELHQQQENVCASALHLIQALIHTCSSRLPRVWLVTRGAQAVDVNESPALVQASLWGLGAVIAVEHPALNCTRIDLDPSCSGLEDKDVFRLFAEICSGKPENQITIRQGQSYVARLLRSGLDEKDGNGDISDKVVITQQLEDRGPGIVAFTVNADASYLVTGGLGVLGLHVAKWLVDRGARNIVLVARHDPSPKAQEAIEALQKGGARIRVVRCDISRQEDVRALLDGLEQLSIPPLRGIVHSAGVLDDDLLLNLNWDRFARVMAPKVGGSWILHQLTKDLQLDFFVLFSSVVSVFGNAGQGNYAAANAFLDALAHYRRNLGLPALSINWGAWAEGGMAAVLGSSGERRMTRLGVSSISPGEGTETMEHLLRSGQTRATVIPIAWRKFLSQYSGAEVPPFFLEMSRREEGASGVDEMAVSWLGGEQESKRPLKREELIAASPSERQRMIMSYLREQLSRVLGASAAKIETQEPLINLGFDSLMAVELKSRIEADLVVSITIADLLQGYGMAQVAATIVDHLSATIENVAREDELRKVTGDNGWNVVNL